MLSRVESLYLAILRIVILAVATIALIVTIFGAVAAIRSFSHWHDTTAEGGNLREYISERKATAANPGSAPTPGTAPAAPSALSYPSEVQEAANNIYDYLHDQKPPAVSEWEKMIDDSAGTDFIQRDAYFGSVLAASKQLKISTGKKLTTDQVKDYLQWNHQQFAMNVDAQAAAKGQSLATGLMALYVTGGAFFFFILIVFVFIFVKIERSLRLVHTVRMEAIDA